MSNPNNLNLNNQIELLLNSVAEEEGFKNYKIEKAPGSMKGDGYIGVITSIRIVGVNKSQEMKELNLIVKSASSSDTLRSVMLIANVFEREIYMYNHVIPTFRKFECEKSLPPFPSSAKCYKACLLDKNEALILEDLKVRGYTIWDRKIPMDHDHLSFVVAEYGRFHALSLALRDQKPALFQKLIEPIDDIFQTFVSNNFLPMFVARCEKAAESLDTINDSEALKVYNKFRKEDLVKFFEGLDKLVDEYSVILHGDCWTNNMMFKYENENEPTKPTGMCIIDLQISKMGPPVLDLSYFFYTCGSKTAITNFEHYLNVYYNSLSMYLRKLGSNPDIVYPYSVFRQQWKDSAKFGMICAMLLIHIMLSNQNEVTDLTDVVESGKCITEAFDYTISSAEEYNDRVRHMILHFVNNNFI